MISLSICQYETKLWYTSKFWLKIYALLGSSCLVKKKKIFFLVFDASLICFGEMMNHIRGVIKCKSYTQHVTVCMFYKIGRSVYIGSNCGQNSKGNWMEFPFVVWPLYLGFILTPKERQIKKETKNYLWIEISCLITYSLDFVSVLPVCWVALDFSGGRVPRWSFFKVGSYNQPYAILGTKYRKKMGKIQVKYKHTHTHTDTYV